MLKLHKKEPLHQLEDAFHWIIDQCKILFNLQKMNYKTMTQIQTYIRKLFEKKSQEAEDQNHHDDKPDSEDNLKTQPTEEYKFHFFHTKYFFPDLGGIMKENNSE